MRLNPSLSHKVSLQITSTLVSVLLTLQLVSSFSTYPQALTRSRRPVPVPVGSSSASIPWSIGGGPISASRTLTSLLSAKDPSSAPNTTQKTTMISNNARRMTTEAVRKTKMYVASKNDKIINWSDLLSSSCLADADAAERCDDGIHPSPLDATSLLKLLPRGAYTTCRTIGRGTSVYQFEYHVRRLASSSSSMIEEGVLPDGVSKLDENVLAAATDVDKVRSQTLSCIKKCVAEFRNQYSDRMFPCDEFRITLLQTWLPEDKTLGLEDSSSGTSSAKMYCHVGILPKRREGEHIKVEVHGHGRNNAAAKDSQWINDRDKVESGCEEYILVNNDGEMLEGTQTNFFLVTKDGRVLTADEGILRGSVRDSVLRVCIENGIPLELRPPNVDDLEHASGVFISSTSRLVMPIHEVVVNVSKDDVSGGNPPKPATYHFPNCEVTKGIQDMVMEDVLTHCASIVD